MKNSIEKLKRACAAFIRTAEQVDLTMQVYKEGWTKRDIVAHVAFWHEYYASVIEALVTHKKPELLRGKYTDINQQGVDTYGEYSLDTLLEKISTAQDYIVDHIEEVEGKIPYKVGSRDYTPQGYIESIAAHLRSHVTDLRRRKVRK